MWEVGQHREGVFFLWISIFHLLEFLLGEDRVFETFHSGMFQCLWPDCTDLQKIGHLLEIKQPNNNLLITDTGWD